MFASRVVGAMPTIKIRLHELTHDKTARDKRFDNPLTQQEVAEAVGVSRQTISDWASGKVERLDIKIVAKLCKYFECRIDDLLQLELDD